MEANLYKLIKGSYIIQYKLTYKYLGMSIHGKITKKYYLYKNHNNNSRYI